MKLGLQGSCLYFVNSVGMKRVRYEQNAAWQQDEVEICDKRKLTWHMFLKRQNVWCRRLTTYLILCPEPHSL